jgi:cyclic pyranopterin phosphate synthase
MSAPFCQACNRVRLTSRGFLKLCLDEDLGIDLKPMLHDNVSMQELGDAISHSILYEKPERHHFTDPDFSRGGRTMARTGG